jgi:hypothetical protein
MALWVAVFLGTAFLLVPALYINLGSKVLPSRTSCWPNRVTRSLAEAGQLVWTNILVRACKQSRPPQTAGHVGLRADGLGILCCGASGDTAVSFVWLLSCISGGVCFC